MKRISIKAILGGWFITALLFISFTFFYSKGEHYVEAFFSNRIINFQTSLRYVLFIILLLHFLIGGFFSGKFAQNSKIFNSAITGLLLAICFVLLISLTTRNLSSKDLYYMTGFFPVIILISMLGGYIAHMQHKKKNIVSFKTEQEKRIEDFGKTSEEEI